MQSRGHVILGVIGAIVVLRLALHGLITYALVTSDDTLYGIVQSVSTAFGSVLDILLLVLVWVLFEAIHRIERESERVQVFMDNVYRRLP